MKITIIFISAFVVFASCKKKTPSEQGEVPAATATTSTTTSVTPVSVASITLTSGSKTMVISGSCGWSLAGGVNYIGANDQTKTLRVFEASFNIQTLPSQTTTYTLVAYNSIDTNPAHVSMSFSEQISGGLFDWDSSNSSGTMTIVVSGNKYSVNLAGISLSAQTNSGFYTNLNVGEYANAGMLTGTLVFYK